MEASYETLLSIQREMLLQTAEVPPVPEHVLKKEPEDQFDALQQEGKWEEVEIEMPQARDGVERERHGVRLELSVPRYYIMKRLLDTELKKLADDVTSKEFFEIFDLANYIRTRARGLKGLEDE